MLELLELVCSPPLASSAVELVVRERRDGGALSELTGVELLADEALARAVLFGDGARVWSERKCGTVDTVGLSLPEVFSSDQLVFKWSNCPVAASREGSKLKPCDFVKLNSGFRSEASAGRCALRREYSKVSRINTVQKKAIKTEMATKLMLVHPNGPMRLSRASKDRSVCLGKVFPASRSGFSPGGVSFSGRTKIPEISTSILRGVGVSSWGFIQSIRSMKCSAYYFRTAALIRFFATFATAVSNHKSVIGA
jgi:hypothetical protein